MSFHVYPHAAVPYGSSLTSGSVEDVVRPNLRRAYPLPGDHEDDPRFRYVLDALAQRTGAQRPEQT